MTYALTQKKSLSSHEGSNHAVGKHSWYAPQRIQARSRLRLFRPTGDQGVDATNDAPATNYEMTTQPTKASPLFLAKRLQAVARLEI